MNRLGTRSIAPFAALFCGIAAASALGAPAFVGNELQVNTYTTDSQGASLLGGVTADAQGNFVVTWASDYQDGDTSGVFAQRFSSAGTMSGTEFQVNTYTTLFQTARTVAGNAAGDFVVLWSSYQDSPGSGDATGIFGQRYASDGSPTGSEFHANSHTLSIQQIPAAAMDSDGDFVVTWQSFGQDGDGYGVFGQRYASDGGKRGGEFQVNSYTTADQTGARIAMEENGDFAVVWRSIGQDGDLGGVFGRRYTSDGSTMGGEFQVNVFTAGNQFSGSVAADADGDFTVAWLGYGQDGDQWAVVARRFDSNGAALGSDFVVNSYTLYSQLNPALAMEPDGDFVVTWMGFFNEPFSPEIVARAFTSDGAAIAPEFMVNTYTTSMQGYPSIAATGQGFILSWQSYAQDGDNFGTFARRLPGIGVAGCSTVPLTACITAAKDLFQVKDDPTDAKDQLKLKHVKSTATVLQSDFGDPIAGGNTYRLCVYDQTAGTDALVTGLAVPGGGPAWSAISDKGYKYLDNSLANAGVQRILLKGGPAGRGKILIKARGVGVPLTGPQASPEYFDVDTRLTVQLSESSTGNCWESTIDAADVRTSTDTRFKGARQ